LDQLRIAFLAMERDCEDMSLRGFWGSHLRKVECSGSGGLLKHVALILVLGFMLLVIPVPFARLHDDEAIYFVVTGDLL